MALEIQVLAWDRHNNVLELVGYQPPFFSLSDNLISSCLYNNSVESLLEGVSNFIGGTDVCNI